MFFGKAQVKRDLEALEARVAVLEGEVDLGELERLRRSVLTALRALRRAEQAAEAREHPVADSRDPAQLNALDPRLAKLRRDVQLSKRGA